MEAPVRTVVAPSAVWRGRPYPLGATWDGAGVNFALFSKHAERVELCLFDPKGRREVERVELRDRTDFVWHCYLPEARPGLLYGYRVHGPHDPDRGHRFDAGKLLLDPYARLIRGKVGAGLGRCQVVDCAFSWGDDRPPRTPWQDTVIYELHVKGFTRLHPYVPEQLRGTYAGLATAPVVAHLQRLGVTAVELLPVHSFVDERRLAQQGLRNYWGYNSIGFFAPEQRYSATDTLGEFKTMVKSLHAAGIEVILDVVYNHTAEGDHNGPMLSFRGIDNLIYYRLDPAPNAAAVLSRGGLPEVPCARCGDRGLRPAALTCCHRVPRREEPKGMVNLWPLELRTYSTRTSRGGAMPGQRYLEAAGTSGSGGLQGISGRRWRRGALGEGPAEGVPGLGRILNRLENRNLRPSHRCRRRNGG